MATLAQVIYDIREAIKDYSDDSELDNRYITYLINVKRERFLKQRIDKLGRNFNNRILQTLCLEVEEVSSSECGLELGCDKILKTKETVPNLVQLTLKDAIQRVGPADQLARKFNLIEKERAALYSYSNFPASIKAFLDNTGYMYFISSEPMFFDCVSVTGVFQDPTSLASYKNCCGCEETSETVCFDVNETEYPADGELLDLIRADILKELIHRDKIQEDTRNDAQDD